MSHYDLVVIGAGRAGEKGAAQAAYFGKRVALVEASSHVGGAGVNTGTIPSKTLRETALYFSGLTQRGLYGIDYSIKDTLEVPDLMYRRHEVSRALREVVRSNIDRHQMELIQGTAQGSPRRVLDQLVALRDEIGHFGTLLMAGHDWDRPAMWKRSMELLAREVVPKLGAHAAAR